jgi:hypothetical protein
MLAKLIIFKDDLKSVKLILVLYTSKKLPIELMLSLDTLYKLLEMPEAL